MSSSRKKIPRTVAIPFAMNLRANVDSPSIGFGPRSFPLATVDIPMGRGTLVWSDP